MESRETNDMPSKLGDGGIMSSKLSTEDPEGKHTGNFEGKLALRFKIVIVVAGQHKLPSV